MHRKRFEVPNKLQGESLVRRELLQSYADRSQLRIMPDLNVVKIGGHGIIDFGRGVVEPLVKEIGELSQEHKMLIVTGGGVRVRHIMDIGLDLGMPTGVLAELAGKVSEQNAIMFSILLSPYHGVRIHQSDLLELPMLMDLGVLPVIHGTPPYGLYEPPTEFGGIPSFRTDTGAFLMAEVLGARSCILVKNVDGLFTSNPATSPDSELIPDITASKLLAMNMEDMVLEPKVVELLPYAHHIREIRIVNGHVPGNIARALNGKRIGTVIRAR
ncbi:MAG: uridylate kinase [Methanomicrobiales archaeon]|nr:uridylate kinase [Methanomicrobiales archaeon]